MSQPRSRLREPAFLVACISITLATMTSAWSEVISSTPTLPVLGVAYGSTTGAGCFPAAGVCVAPGLLTPTSVVSSVFNASGQDIVTSVSYVSTLTTLSNVLIGPVMLFGTMEQEVLGRTLPDELGTWMVDLLDLTLSGTVLGRTLTLKLDGSTPSTGSTSITPVGDAPASSFRIDSFFDVFVELTLDTVPPLVTTRALHVSLVPEPSALALVAGGLVAFAARRRRTVASS